MGKLTEALSGPGNKARVVEDCARIIDEEVADKSGLTGLAIKAVYKTVKGIKPGFIAHAVENLLPEFAQKLEPFWEERQRTAAGEPMDRWLVRRSGAVADALLEVTDRRAERSDRGAVRSAYERLRPSGKRNVEEAMPRIGQLIDKHVK